MKNKLYVIHAPGTELEIEKVPSLYCGRDVAYAYFDKEAAEIALADAYRAEKEKNEWIRKYDNLLKGLNHCKSKLGYK